VDHNSDIGTVLETAGAVAVGPERITPRSQPSTAVVTCLGSSLLPTLRFQQTTWQQRVLQQGSRAQLTAWPPAAGWNQNRFVCLQGRTAAGAVDLPLV